MHIVFHARHQRLAVLEKNALALWDLTTGAPVLRASTALLSGDNANGCEAWVGVLAGKVAPAGGSLRAATLHRFDWDLTALPSPVLGEVARHTLSPSADGAWVAATNWKNARVTVFDAATGAVRGANGEGIPSGPSFSPDGLTLVAGAVDQGSGAVLAFDLTEVNQGTLSMSQLPAPVRGHPGLDDAPFFSVFSRDGRHAALSNESWGGRGVCVYDMSRRAPVWSVTLPGTDEEPENWFAFQAEFASLDRILLLAGPRALRAFAVEDGRDLGSVPLPGDGRQGFALDEAFWRVWVPGLAVGAAPVAVALPDAWREVFAVADPPKRRTRKKKS